MLIGPLVETTPAPKGALGNAVFRARHRLIDTDLFSDESLAQIIDNHPRNAWTISGMGASPEAYMDWGTGDASGLDGSEILRAIRKGRLWLNIRRVSDHHPEFAEIVSQLYRELGRIDPAFRPTGCFGGLLISSSRALVHMHVDAAQNILWHLRGRKRVWVYPAGDPRFASRDDLEAIAAHARIEDLPYAPGMDSHAERHDLVPGDWLIWPHHSPHRVENLCDLNVSMTTAHATQEGLRKLRVLRANYFLKTRLRLPVSSMKTRGINYLAKSAIGASFAAAQKLGLSKPVRFAYPTTFRVNPDAPEGIVPFHQDSY